MIAFVLLFFRCLMTLIREIEMSLNYFPAITSFSHKELLKLPPGLSVGRICMSFVREIAEKLEKPMSRFLAVSSVCFGTVDFCPNLQPCE